MFGVSILRSAYCSLLLHVAWDGTMFAHVLQILARRFPLMGRTLSVLGSRYENVRIIRSRCGDVTHHVCRCEASVCIAVYCAHDQTLQNQARLRCQLHARSSHHLCGGFESQAAHTVVT